MMYMNNVLNDSSIPNNSGIAIEFKIPYTSKRIDFIITGRDNQKRNVAIIIELKQWTEAEIVDGQDGIVRTFIRLIKHGLMQHILKTLMKMFKVPMLNYYHVHIYTIMKMLNLRLYCQINIRII